MGLGVRGFMRIGAAIAGCALVAACTPDQPPTVTPTPTATPSATPSATPTETNIERQMRLDFEAAEKAYRTAIAESDRLAQSGGARKPTAVLKGSATGDYLRVLIADLRTFESRGWRLKGGVTILNVSRSGGWTSTKLELTACEDNSTWKVLDQKGQDVTPKNQPDYIQSLTATNSQGVWKISDSSTRKVANVERSDCQS